MGLLRNKTQYVVEKNVSTKTEVFTRTFETIEVIFSSGRTERFEDVHITHKGGGVEVKEFEGVEFHILNPSLRFSDIRYSEVEPGKTFDKKYDPLEQGIKCEWKMSTISDINADFFEQINHIEETEKKVAHTAEITEYKWVEK